MKTVRIANISRVFEDEKMKFNFFAKDNRCGFSDESILFLRRHD